VIDLLESRHLGDVLCHRLLAMRERVHISGMREILGTWW